jgi:hypothetical protein
MDSTAIAMVLTPILGPAIWWLLLAPGRFAHRFVWKCFPLGALRSFLIARVGASRRAAKHHRRRTGHAGQPLKRLAPTIDQVITKR